jgi:hypothetical protein
MNDIDELNQLLAMSTSIRENISNCDIEGGITDGLEIEFEDDYEDRILAEEDSDSIKPDASVTKPSSKEKNDVNSLTAAVMEGFKQINGGTPMNITFKKDDTTEEDSLEQSVIHAESEAQKPNVDSDLLQPPVVTEMDQLEIVLEIMVLNGELELTYDENGEKMYRSVL